MGQKQANLFDELLPGVSVRNRHGHFPESAALKGGGNRLRGYRLGTEFRSDTKTKRDASCHQQPHYRSFRPGTEREASCLTTSAFVMP